jgi:Ca-activated chloride channel family protein
MNQNLFGIQLKSDKNLISRETKTERILEIRVQAPVPSKEKSRPSLNLALVLDRSGSMQGEKLEYVKQAAIHVLDQLKEQDQVALVVYDNTIQVLAHNINITNGNRFELKRIVSGIEAGNMTNLGGGWLIGCKEIASSAREGTINRTMLLTDGLANVGETDLEVLSLHALEIYKDSISTSTFGVGEGFNEHLLEAMANRGGGNFYFIPQPDQIPQIFLKEFNDLVGITARKVEIKLDLPVSVEWKVLGGWSAEYKDGRLHIYVGDMPAGKTQDIYVKLQIPSNEKSGEITLNAKAFAQGESGELLEDQAKAIFQYADQIDVEAAPVNREVMERFSVVELADTATEALKLEREGERDRASQMVNENIIRNRPYISHKDAALYQQRSDRMKSGMTEADRKQTHYEVYNIKRQKEDKDKGKE